MDAKGAKRSAKTLATNFSKSFFQKYLLIQFQESKYKLDFENLSETIDHEVKDEFTLAPVILNKKMTSDDHFQDTRLIEFDIGEKLNFNPGDICLVQPKNSPKNVDKFLNLFSHYDPDKPFKLLKNDANAMLPPKCVISNGAKITNLR